MVREPCEYTIHGRVVRIGPQEFVVMVTATAVDHFGPGSSFTENAKAGTRDAAVKCLWKMVRDLSARLRAQGNRVVTVDTDV